MKRAWPAMKQSVNKLQYQENQNWRLSGTWENGWE